jgi:sugar phosphate isomerase/epimerase
MMQATIPDSVDGYLDLIRAVDRPEFAAHIDPVNLVMTPRTYFSTGALIRECFEKLGPWIVSCHAKDITLRQEAALHLDEVQIGEGNLDYRTYLNLLDAMPREIPLMLEHLDAPDYAVARDRVFAVGDQIGVAFAVRP